MKKIILILLGLMILGGTSPSYAKRYDPFAGTKLEGKENREITSSFKLSFPILYQITKDDIDSERALSAFSMLARTYKANKLDKKYENNEIKSEELKNIIGGIISAIENPKTAKDYFYKSILAYSESDHEPVSQTAIDTFEYIIDNFPDSIYAEYSLFYLAGKYRFKGKITKAIELYNQYLTKYGEKAKLKPHVYYNFATIYINPFGGAFMKGSNPDEQWAFMMKYAEKFINEYPQYKEMAGRTLLRLGDYYKDKGNYDKAIEYYTKIYTDSDPSKFHINSSINRVRKIYIKRKDYNKAKKLLDYSYSRFKENISFMKFYKMARKKNEMIIHFGYDDEITEQRLKANQITKEEYNENMSKYKEKKDEIEKFKKEYETHFDKDFNIIKPFKEEKEDKEKKEKQEK
jgi:tetratricopeptide (TPR) repeat protein